MTKQIKVQETESGLRYFYIYVVKFTSRGRKSVVHDYFSSKKEAERTRDFLLQECGDTYEYVWVSQEMVWC